MSMLPGAKRAEHKRPRQADDWYRESRLAVEALFDEVIFTGPIHDPACGDGLIPIIAQEQGYAASGSDLVGRGYGEGGIDFLTDFTSRTTLIFNAPYSLNEAFISHALAVASAEVAAIARVTFLCGQWRYRNLWAPSPPASLCRCRDARACRPVTVRARQRTVLLTMPGSVWSKGPLRWRCTSVDTVLTWAPP